MESMTPHPTPSLTDGRTRGTRSALKWLVPFALIAAFSVLWALASPVFSVPDENAHAVKAIAQLRGEVIGRTEPGRMHIIVDLPEGFDYNHSMMCYLFAAEEPAACNAEFGDGSGEDDFATWVGAYNPIYYYLVGWPSLVFDDGVTAVYAMRVASALLSALLLAWAFQAGLAMRDTRWMPFGLSFLAMPMVVYLAGSVNPNGVEIAAGAALWIGLFRLLQSYGPTRLSIDPPTLPRWYLWLIVAVAAIMLVNARAIGPLWVVVIVGACLVIAGWTTTKRLFTDPRAYPWLGGIAAGSLFAIVWTLVTGGTEGQAGADDAPLVGASALTGVVAMLRRTGDWVQQALGYFGWLDTPLPADLYALIYVALGFLVLLAFLGTNRRGVWITGAVIAGAILVPAVVQGVQVGRTGLIWQGRYGIVLMVAIPIFAALVLAAPSSERLAFLARRTSWVGVAAVSVFGFGAFLVVLRRYVTGVDVPWSTMITAPSWQPPTGWIPLVAAYGVVSVLFAIWLVWESRISPRQVEDLRAERPAHD
jgi:hypothetical protein